MQHRSEHLAFEIADGADLDQRRREEKAVRAIRPERLAWTRGPGPHRRYVALQPRESLRRNDRADVAGEPIGRTDMKLAHRRLEHLERAVGDVVLQAEHAQRRAALAGRIESGGERVGYDLLGKRGTVDDQRVLAAGLGDQRNRRAVGAEPLGKRGLR